MLQTVNKNCMLDLCSTMERVVEVGNKGESQYKQSWMIDCIVLECDVYVACNI